MKRKTHASVLFLLNKLAASVFLNFVTASTQSVTLKNEKLSQKSTIPKGAFAFFAVFRSHQDI